MSAHWRTIIAIFFGSMAVASAADDAPPPIRQFDIPTIERLGREMYEQDQEAWKATDILFAKHSRAELRAEKQQLWVVDKLPDRDIVRFVDNRDTGPVPAYDVTFVAGKDPVLSSSVEATLTLDELAQYDARLLAGKNVTRPCAPTYNTIALKDPAGDKWLVWAMAATTDPNALVIGGHYRFTISKDGMSLIESDTLSRGCLTIERPKLDNDATPEGAFVTSVVSSLPLEIHVFANLTYHDVLRVGTPDGKTWKIDQGALSQVQLDSPGADGFVARNYAGQNETCMPIFEKQVGGKPGYSVGSVTQVIEATEKADKFSVGAPEGASTVGITCARDSIVPAPNDYKVLATGYKLTIFERRPGTREGEFSYANGRVTFALKKGDPLTASDQAAIDARLAVFQKALSATH